jgi:O-antigen/teichoic acid export membrane protein
MTVATSATARAVPEGHHVVRNTLLGLVQQVAGIGVGILLVPFMLSRLGVQRYGYLLLAQILSISGVLATADFGLQSSFIRFLAGHHVQGRTEEFRRLLATSLATFLTIGAVCGIFVFAFSRLAFFHVFHVEPSARASVATALDVYAGTFALQFAVFGLKAFYAGVQDLVRLKVWEILERASYGVAVVIVVLRWQAIVPVVVAEQVVVLGLATCFAVVAARRYPAHFTVRFWRGSWRALRGVTSLSAQIFSNYLSVFVVYLRAPDIIVGSLLGPVYLTYLSIVMKLPKAIKALSSAANSAVFPAASALDALDQRRRVGNLVLRGSRYTYLLLTPVIVFILVYADEILRVWVGPRYVFLAGLLRAFVLWQYVISLVLFMRAVFTRAEQYRRLTGYTLAGNALFFVIALVGVGRAGLWALAGGLLVSAAVTVTGSLEVQRVSLEVGYPEFFAQVVRLPVLLLGIGSAATLALVRVAVGPLTLVGLGVVFACFFSACLLLVFRLGMGEAERTQISTLVRRLARA